MKIKDVRELEDLYRTKEFKALPRYRRIWLRILISIAAFIESL